MAATSRFAETSRCQGRALRARPADAARRPTDAEPQRRGRGAERAPPARGAPPAANFFRAPHAQKLHRNTIFATAPLATAMPRTPFWAGFWVQICAGVGTPGVGENLACAFGKPPNIAPK